MSRLGGYLMGRFFGEAIALALIVVPLLYLVQCFRILDVVSVKGQDLITLFSQGALSIPLIGKIFFYVCAATGMARVLAAMQLNGELHAIHAGGRLKALFGAVAGFTGIVTVLVLLLAHFGSPMSLRELDDWSAEIAADLVGRALKPRRFVEVVPGVTVVIAAREGEGHISGFFADDRRDPRQRTTYSAVSAIIARDDKGYVLQMDDGAIQYMTEDMRFSEIRFSRYDLAVDLLTTAPESGNIETWALVVNSYRENSWSPYAIFLLIDRTSEGLRVIGICLLIFAIAGFPHARRGMSISLELVVLAVAFAERGYTAYAPDFLGVFRPAAGALAMTVAGALLLSYRLWFARYANAALGALRLRAA